jgi:hypothetical protein
MPRIRTLKPEHRQHRKVGALTHRQYRLWVGMISEADDDGRLVADAKWLRAVVFPYHDKLSVGRVEEALQAIAKSGAIVLYRHGDTRYAWFPSWRDHQKLDRAHYTPSRLPPPPSLDSDESISRSIGSLSRDSSETRASQGSEGKGREPNYSGKGRESEGRETTMSHDTGSTATNGLDPRPPETDEEVAVYAKALGITVGEARQRSEAARRRAARTGGSRSTA